jgi:hypothetical protein
MSKTSEQIKQEMVVSVHASNILGFLSSEVLGRLSDDDHALSESIINNYILRYFSDSENVSLNKES